MILSTLLDCFSLRCSLIQALKLKSRSGVHAAVTRQNWFGVDESGALNLSAYWRYVRPFLCLHLKSICRNIFSTKGLNLFFFCQMIYYTKLLRKSKSFSLPPPELAWKALRSSQHECFICNGLLDFQNKRLCGQASNDGWYTKPSKTFKIKRADNQFTWHIMTLGTSNSCSFVTFRLVRFWKRSYMWLN